MSTKSATLSYLKQNIRDSRLSDWTFQPIPHQALLDKLSQEMLDFEKWVNQTNEKEDKLIAELLGKLKQNINEIYSNAEVIRLSLIILLFPRVVHCFWFICERFVPPLERHWRRYQIAHEYTSCCVFRCCGTTFKGKGIDLYIVCKWLPLEKGLGWRGEKIHAFDAQSRLEKKHSQQDLRDQSLGKSLLSLEQYRADSGIYELLSDVAAVEFSLETLPVHAKIKHNSHEPSKLHHIHSQFNKVLMAIGRLRVLFALSNGGILSPNTL